MQELHDGLQLGATHEAQHFRRKAGAMEAITCRKQVEGRQPWAQPLQQQKVSCLYDQCFCFSEQIEIGFKTHRDYWRAIL